MDEPTTSMATSTPAKSTPGNRLGCPPNSNSQPTAVGFSAETPAEELKVESVIQCVLSSPTLSDCRRSSRKKVTKFDVLDVLNKNRKPNKPQTNARSECSVPATSTCSLNKVDVATATPVAGADLQLATGSPLPSLSLVDLFVKPEPTQCVTLEQECSGESHLADIQSEGEQNLPTQEMRTRRQVRKAQAGLVSQDVGGRTAGINQSISSDTNLSTADSEIDTYTENLLKTLFKTKVRVMIKRITLPTIRETPADTEIIMKTDIITDEDVDQSKKKQPTAKTDKQLPQSTISSLSETNEKKEQMEDSALLTASPVPSTSRRSKRSCLRVSTHTIYGFKMTLEETFAEIAAVSSKIVMESEFAATDLIENNEQLDAHSESNCKLEITEQVPTTDIQSEITFNLQLEGFGSVTKPESMTTDTSILIPIELPVQQTADTRTAEQQGSLDNKLAIPIKESHTLPSSALLPIMSNTAACVKTFLSPLEADHKLDTAMHKAEAKSIATSSCNEAVITNQEKEKAASVSIVECDALFKALDKASAQMRQEKTKKKLKLAKQTAKREQKERNHSNKNSSSAIKQLPIQISRTNIICADRAEKTPTLFTKNQQRSSQPPGKVLPPESDTVSKAKSKILAHKGPSTPIGSNSSASLFVFKRKPGKISDALRLLLGETESSESTNDSSKEQSGGIPTPTAELEASNAVTELGQFTTDDKPDEPSEVEFSRRVANIETPATTPSTSPQPSATSIEDSAGNTVRRSHRIRQQQPKASSSNSSINSNNPTPSSIKMEEQLAELAHIEAINEQFLRQEGLYTFQFLRDNYYRCARQISQENAEMQCDCLFTSDDEAMGYMFCGEGCINRMLMIECGPLCTYGDRCSNKRFQLHQCWPCRVFRTEKKGCGITAELQIPPGEFIMEYVGEVIDNEEFERRQYIYSRDRNRHYYFMSLRGEAIIDATTKGNISRYINHSCSPNAETQKWTVNGELRIGFFSVKTIMAGEEITFNYQYQRYGRDAQPCYCEAPNCRGWIGGEPDSTEGEQLDEESESEVEDLAEELDEQEPGQSQGLEVEKKGQKGKGSKLIKSKPSKPAKVPPAARKKPPKDKDREYKAGRWLRPSSSGSSTGGGSGSGEKSLLRIPKMREDPDVLEQLRQLNRTGLKNQADTLNLSRCMVRVKLLESRLQLLDKLTHAELPCRRLFLDYHGLRLLHAWMSESGNDNQLRLALIETLESLPIPNRTMLNESRVYQSVELWSTSMSVEETKDAINQNAQEQQSKLKSEMAAMPQRLQALLQKWNALPEIFRIPKRERIEQMKEHEREADRQQPTPYGATALEDNNNKSAAATLNSDRYKQDRFRRDTNRDKRYEKPKPVRMAGNNTQERNGSGDGPSTSQGKSDSRRRSDEKLRNMTKKQRRSLFERKVAQDEAEKRVGSVEKRVCSVEKHVGSVEKHVEKRVDSVEKHVSSVEKRVGSVESRVGSVEKRVGSVDKREHEARCEYFGVDPSTDPKQLPFYENTETGEWFNSDDVKVAKPLRCGKDNASGSGVSSKEKSPESGDAPEYKLPANVEPLPPSWHWSVTPEGNIFYYNLLDRVSQWEPPNAQQRLEQLIDDSPEPELTEEEKKLLNNDLVSIDVDFVGTLNDKELADYIEAKVKERRNNRHERLVSVCMISPRREEDRVHNQLESRKYKENKEKIRRRKENLLRIKNEVNNEEPGGAKDLVPIQGYLYSSDEELDPTANKAKLDSVVQPLSDIPVEANNDVRMDELNTLNVIKNYKNKTEESNNSILGQTSSDSDGESILNSKRKLPMPPLTDSKKKHRSERERKRTTSLSSTSSGREACEKFRIEVSDHVAEFLRPYRKDSCQLGRITSDEDYEFLIKRLSHHITTKEMRYCESNGNSLACTESVKNKSFEFINQYMQKKGRVYQKPDDEPDY